MIRRVRKSSCSLTERALGKAKVRRGGRQKATARRTDFSHWSHLISPVKRLACQPRRVAPEGSGRRGDVRRRPIHRRCQPPAGAILAVGTMRPKPVAREGEVVVRTCMTMTLTSDHRVLYGADAAQFVARIRELLENPLALLAGSG